VASGSIVVATYLRHRDRVLEPVVDAVSDQLSRYVVRAAKHQARRWRRSVAADEGPDAKRASSPLAYPSPVRLIAVTEAFARLCRRR
jgi:hypothetical protein